ncbi:MAG: transglutaminase domain-containing protein [Candidatus Acidiferrales bacterium]
MPAQIPASAKRRFLIAITFYALNALVVSSFFLALAGAMWEYTTREYLRGFVDAIVPQEASQEQKVDAILKWMEGGPARKAGRPVDDVTSRDPLDTLNYQSLINVCGGAVNAFVNLADASGLESRRLLLLSPALATTHVVAEVRLDGRWIIVDPVFHAFMRDASGRMLTRSELADPEVLRQATQHIDKYDPQYSYTISTHIRFSALPFVGRSFQERIDSISSRSGYAMDWTLLFERRSYAAMVSGALLFLFFLLVRRMFFRWGLKHMPAAPFSLLEELKFGGRMLIGSRGESWQGEEKVKTT